jgi:hypothetical protein
MALAPPLTGKLRRDTAAIIGDDVIFRGSIHHIADSLHISGTAAIRALSPYAVSPAALGLNPRNYGIDNKVLVYPVRRVWNYLK